MHYDYSESQVTPSTQIIYALNAEEIQARVDRARRELAGVSLLLEEQIVSAREKLAALPNLPK